MIALAPESGIIAVPTALQAPATVAASRELEDDVKVVLRDLNDYLTRRRHRSSDGELHARYDHPHYGERGGVNQEVTIGAGNDQLYGDTGRRRDPGRQRLAVRDVAGGQAWPAAGLVERAGLRFEVPVAGRF